MSGLSKEFYRDDIETLIESVGDWEASNNHDYYLLQLVKSMPMPPEDHESYDVMMQVKDSFKQKEKEIVKSRDVRQEKSVFLKAKLMLVRRDLAIHQAFDMASVESLESVKPSKPPTETDDYKRKFEIAKMYITDLGAGVWKSFENYLKEKEKDLT
jgi:hypothetical protein